ncbi:macrophage mannose receptor 1-like [Hemibagrus wyckioides]|uniref:macrophage mannose receptor 1-like n=1 Tax=Hemibagrus wyckioides TaxID=337641 RepID=UPI00266C5093|nr:macrophage mannose receptor 1-like [Hemibagrus wyckioides]
MSLQFAIYDLFNKMAVQARIKEAAKDQVIQNLKTSLSKKRAMHTTAARKVVLPVASSPDHHHSSDDATNIGSPQHPDIGDDWDEEIRLPSTQRIATCIFRKPRMFRSKRKSSSVEAGTAKKRQAIMMETKELYDNTGHGMPPQVDEIIASLHEKNKNPKYVVINETKRWYDAQIYCREKYTDLVSVRNQTENEEIWRMINSSVHQKVWIGLFNDSWKWSDQSNSLFRYWSSDKPSGGLNCSAVSESEKRYWSDVNCTEKLPFICHENKLILINENLTWKEALRYCRNHHHDLVSVRTEEMQLWVKEVAQNTSNEHVWLGLRHTCTLGFWYWVNGEMICYQDWAPGNGTGFEDCSHEERTGAVQSGGEQKWISLPQSEKLNFICSAYD